MKPNTKLSERIGHLKGVCGVCHGTGKIPKSWHKSGICQICGGWGVICDHCDGNLSAWEPRTPEPSAPDCGEGYEFCSREEAEQIWFADSWQDITIGDLMLVGKDVHYRRKVKPSAQTGEALMRDFKGVCDREPSAPEQCDKCGRIPAKCFCDMNQSNRDEDQMRKEIISASNAFLDEMTEPSAPEEKRLTCYTCGCEIRTNLLDREDEEQFCGDECYEEWLYSPLPKKPEPSAPEPKRCCETCRWVATKFNCEPCITCIDYSKWKAPEQNAPEQSGVEWLEVDAIKDDEGIYACLFQLQQVCTEQAKAYIRLRRFHNDLAIKHHDLEQVVTKQAERIAALEKRLEGGE